MSVLSVLLIWTGNKEIKAIQDDLENKTEKSASVRALKARTFDQALLLGDHSYSTMRKTAELLTSIVKTQTTISTAERLSERDMSFRKIYRYTATILTKYKEDNSDKAIEFYYLISTGPSQITSIWTYMSRLEPFAGRLVYSSSPTNIEYVVPESWSVHAETPPLQIPTIAGDCLYGSSQAVQQIKNAIQSAAEHNSPVLLIGEPGTGIHSVARAIHDRHPVFSRNMFHTVQCPAVDSEFRRFFTQDFSRRATEMRQSQRSGSFRNGTVFLDDIGNLSYAQQDALLQFLETSQSRNKTGKDHQEIRIIAATRRNLDDLVLQGVFHDRLLDLLSTDIIRVPPLRERKEDIPELLTQKIKAFLAVNTRETNIIARGISDVALEALCEYDWPGNIRQLESFIVSALRSVQHEIIDETDIENRLKLLPGWKPPENKGITAALPPGMKLDDYLKAVEKSCIENAITQVTFQAALTRILGLDNDGKTSNRLKNHQIDPGSINPNWKTNKNRKTSNN